AGRIPRTRPKYLAARRATPDAGWCRPCSNNPATVGRLSPDYYCMDGTIPRRELPGVLQGISALSEEYGL
ncbi:hypothetical protein QCD79_34975, partial [Pseudomonas quasicaspiana]|nr:hypothetical protein [Pseudomonas quasicaspiana]